MSHRNKNFDSNTFNMRQLEYEHHATVEILGQQLENNKLQWEFQIPKTRKDVL